MPRIDYDFSDHVLHHELSNAIMPTLVAQIEDAAYRLAREADESVDEQPRPFLLDAAAQEIIYQIVRFLVQDDMDEFWTLVHPTQLKPAYFKDFWPQSHTSKE